MQPRSSGEGPARFASIPTGQRRPRSSDLQLYGVSIALALHHQPFKRREIMRTLHGPYLGVWSPSYLRYLRYLN